MDAFENVDSNGENHNNIDNEISTSRVTTSSLPVLIDTADNQSVSQLQFSNRKNSISVTSMLSFDNNEIIVRDAPSVAMSECTKPDPPSIVDHVILEDKHNGSSIYFKQSNAIDDNYRSDSRVNFEFVVSSQDSGNISFVVRNDDDDDGNCSLDEGYNKNRSNNDRGLTKQISSLDDDDPDLTTEFTLKTLPSNDSPLEPEADRASIHLKGKQEKILIDESGYFSQTDIPMVTERTLRPSYPKESLQALDEHSEVLQGRVASIFEKERHHSHFSQDLQGSFDNSTGLIDAKKAIIASNTDMSSIPIVSKTNTIKNVWGEKGSYATSRGTNSMVAGRRKITLKLVEDVRSAQRKNEPSSTRSSILGQLRRNSTNIIFGGSRRGLSLSTFDELNDLGSSHGAPLYSFVPRGNISVSWFEGTSSIEVQEHVRRCIIRKLVRSHGVSQNIELEDLRILDDSVDPHEEIVLSPFIPDGSSFVCRFSTRDPSNLMEGSSTPLSAYSMLRMPVSPGTAPSPPREPDMFGGLSANQLALVKKKLSAPFTSASPRRRKTEQYVKQEFKDPSFEKLIDNQIDPDNNSATMQSDFERNKDDIDEKEGEDIDDAASKALTEDCEDDTMLHTEDPIETRFREIFQLLLSQRRKNNSSLREKIHQDRSHVIFVVSNYLVLFLAVVAISAEIQARIPTWLKMMENQLQNVHNCGATQEALFECVSRGDLAGLFASIGLWFSRSVATKRIFLFGFESPKKLWTVVYESLVSAVCWGVSHLFIRRGLNPDTRDRFIEKHWKDTLYGTLAVIFAAFLKTILKNFVPQEVVEDALRDRQIRILQWLPGLAY